MLCDHDFIEGDVLAWVYGSPVSSVSLTVCCPLFLLCSVLCRLHAVLLDLVPRTSRCVAMGRVIRSCAIKCLVYTKCHRTITKRNRRI